MQHEREHYEYIIKEGRIVHKQCGIFLDTRKDSKEEKWIFVVSSEKKIYSGVVHVHLSISKIHLLL
jgi:hypothetical protein